MSQRRRVRDMSKHQIEWDFGARAIKITPKINDGSTTEEFGLGNSLISINLNNSPASIVQKITGDTDKHRLTPISLMGVRGWQVLLGGVHKKPLKLPTFNAGLKTLFFAEATTVEINQTKPATITAEDWVDYRIPSGVALEGAGKRDIGVGTATSLGGLSFQAEQACYITMFSARRGAIASLDGQNINIRSVLPKREDGYVSDSDIREVGGELRALLMQREELVEICANPGNGVKVRTSLGNVYTLSLSPLTLEPMKPTLVSRGILKISPYFNHKANGNGVLTPQGVVPTIGNQIVNVYRSGDKVSLVNDTFISNGENPIVTMPKVSVDRRSSDGCIGRVVAKDTTGTGLRSYVYATVATGATPALPFPTSAITAWMAENGRSWTLGWSGWGNVGHVVDMGDERYTGLSNFSKKAQKSISGVVDFADPQGINLIDGNSADILTSIYTGKDIENTLAVFNPNAKTTLVAGDCYFSIGEEHEPAIL